jgi:hypothetical protein
MQAYAQWRGTGITRTDVPVQGTKSTEMHLSNLDFVQAARVKDRLVQQWLARFGR